MRDKILSDLVDLTDQMAVELSGDSRNRLTNAEKDKLLKTWNIMRQSIGAPTSPGDRPMGEAFNSRPPQTKPADVVYLKSAFH